jgi:hypothetical protein
MKKNWFVPNLTVAGMLVVAALIFYAALRGSTSTAAQTRGTNEDVGQSGFPAFSADESTAIAPDTSELSLEALPSPVPGDTLVYFVPSDNDSTATVIFLYNTDSVAHIVALRGFSYNGVLVYSLNINVGASSFLRLASDSIASAPPPSWATPAPIITNFTDFTYFASLDLPPGVNAEGYTLFNPGTGVVDPRADQGAIPLQFKSIAPIATRSPTPTMPSPMSTPSPIGRGVR